MNKSFLFVTKDYWPGVVCCFNNMISVILEMFPDAHVDKFYLGKEGVGVDLLKKIKKNPPDFLFIGGWDNQMKMVVLNASQQTKVILKWCSPITQIELGGEMPQFAEIWHFSKTDKIHHVGFGLESDVKTLNCVNDKVVLLPVYMDTSYLDHVKAIDINHDRVNCDIFCAVNPRKNILAQVLALSNFNDEINLHINYSNNAHNIYPMIIGNIITNLKNHGWIGDREKYLSLIKSMDFAMQVTLSESLNYTAAEHACFSIPVILSEAIPFAQNAKEIEKIIIKRPEDLEEIKKATELLVRNPEFRKEMGEASKLVFERYNKKSKEILQNNLLEILK